MARDARVGDEVGLVELGRREPGDGLVHPGIGFAAGAMQADDMIEQGAGGGLAAFVEPDAGQDGAVQSTESTIGPYALHDFSLFHTLRRMSPPSKKYSRRTASAKRPSSECSWARAIPRGDGLSIGLLPWPNSFVPALTHASWRFSGPRNVSLCRAFVPCSRLRL